MTISVLLIWSTDFCLCWQKIQDEQDNFKNLAVHLLTQTYLKQCSYPFSTSCDSPFRALFTSTIAVEVVMSQRKKNNLLNFASESCRWWSSEPYIDSVTFVQQALLVPATGSAWGGNTKIIRGYRCLFFRVQFFRKTAWETRFPGITYITQCFSEKKIGRACGECSQKKQYATKTFHGL